MGVWLLPLTDFIKCHSSPILHRGIPVSRTARCVEVLSTSRLCGILCGLAYLVHVLLHIRFPRRVHHFGDVSFCEESSLNPRLRRCARLRSAMMVDERSKCLPAVALGELGGAAYIVQVTGPGPGSGESLLLNSRHQRATNLADCIVYSVCRYRQPLSTCGCSFVTSPFFLSFFPQQRQRPDPATAYHSTLQSFEPFVSSYRFVCME